MNAKSTVDGFSLKELDLSQHLLRYRCSYLIQSATFDLLQPTLRRKVLQRLWRVLTDAPSEPRYDYLAISERDAWVIPTSGHATLIEHQDEFNKYVDEFFSKP